MSLLPRESKTNAVVLVVGDEHDARHSTARALASAGYEVMEAAGHEAVSAARTRRLLAVVLDGDLPGLSGFDECSKIKQLSPDDLPVLHLSSAAAVDRLRSLRLGVDRSLIKPVAPAKVLATLASLLPENDRRGRRGEDGDRRRRQRGSTDRRKTSTAIHPVIQFGSLAKAGDSGADQTDP